MSWDKLIGVNVYIMTTEFPGRIRGVPVALPHRPAHDAAPDHQLILTDREVRILKRRIASYIEQCYRRKLKDEPRYDAAQQEARKECGP